MARSYLRDFHLYVPADCVASISPDDSTAALAHMERVLEADVRPSAGLDLDGLIRRARA